MKLVFRYLLATLFLHSATAQTSSVEFSHYVLPEFILGKVLMKDGTVNEVSLNYNALTEEMVFENEEQKVAIADGQLKEIDTVYLAEKKFVRRNGTFLEFIKSSEPELYIEYKCRIKYPGRVNGPGGRTSQTSSSETYQPAGYKRIIYEVVLPTGYDTSPYRYYWIEKNAEFTKFKNLKQLMKLYPNKKEFFKAYIKKNAVAFDQQESIIKLVQNLELD